MRMVAITDIPDREALHSSLSWLGYTEHYILRILGQADRFPVMCRTGGFIPITHARILLDGSIHFPYSKVKKERMLQALVIDHCYNMPQ